MSLAPAPGVVVGGRYRLERALGRGGMGSVWAARNTATHRDVALKFLRGPAHTRAELRRRLLREARAATAVKHPNVVEVIDLFEHDEDTPVLVMNLLTGETLRDRLTREETLGVRETANVLVPVVSAVGTAHACGIVHRDLKPENIFLDRSHSGGERVLVLDFGIAKLLGAKAAAEEPALVTHTGSTLGTPCYMAPEQAAAERDIDHRVDVWAIGVILYECLTGMRPIDGDSIGQIVMRLMTTGITPIERVLLDVPADIARLVGSMLARERDHRAADLRPAFDVLSAHADVRAPSFGEPSSEVPPAQAISGADQAPSPTVIGAGAIDAQAVTELPPGRHVRRRVLAVGIALAIGAGALGLAVERSRHAESSDATNTAVTAAPPSLETVKARPTKGPAPASTPVGSAAQEPQPLPPNVATSGSKPLRTKSPKEPATAKPSAPITAPTGALPPPVASPAPKPRGGLEETPPF